MKVRRLQKIESYIHAEGQVSIDELCSQFQVSKNTIRRDLNRLEKDGQVVKIYGGVSSLSPAAASFKQQGAEHNREKKAIARKAAQCVEDNDMIYIDSGTTTCHLVNYIDESLRVTILTNSLDVLNQSVNHPNCTVLLLGNIFKCNTRSFSNVQNGSFFQRLNINKSFLSATGVALKGGVTNSEVYEYPVKQQILRKSLHNHLLVDTSKFGRAGFVTFAQIADFDTIYTGPAIPTAFRSHCQQHNVTVITAPE